MIVVPCPWCEAPAQVGDANLVCEACRIEVELREEGRTPELAAAA